MTRLNLVKHCVRYLCFYNLIFLIYCRGEKLPSCSIRPNIIFIVADDAGWNDFSFHGSPQIPTPNIDALAFNGIILNKYYGSSLGTPTRGAIMTGKHPIHLRLQHYVITSGMEEGLPLEEKLMPEYFQELGYATHLIGKWHLGHAREVFTPTFRGFDSHYGYWLGMHDYYDHFMKDKTGFGYDFRRDMKVNYAAFGHYTTDLFTDEAIRIINQNPQGKPLFLMINHLAPHSANSISPLQAPFENVDKFNGTIENCARRVYAGMVDRLDQSVGLVVEALSKSGLMKNSIIVFTSDNGGAPEGFDMNAGSNWPLRGAKNSLWEGGMHIAGFVWSPNLENRVSNDLMRLEDWLPTLYEASGGNVSALTGIDGVSHWKVLKGEDTNPVRVELLHNIDDIYNRSAVRFGPWKLLQGNVSNAELGAGFHWDSWYGPTGRDENKTVQDLIPGIMNSHTAHALARLGIKLNETRIKKLQIEAELVCKDRDPEDPQPCDPYNTPCLFNIDNDPCEYLNVADSEPDIVKQLLSLIAEYNKTATVPLDRTNNPKASPKNWNYVWTNWKDYEEEEEEEEPIE